MPAVTTYAKTGNAYIDGVLGDGKWAVSDLTYSFPTSGSYYGTGYGWGEPTNGFGVLNSTQQAATRAVFSNFSAVANLRFTEITATTPTPSKAIMPIRPSCMKWGTRSGCNTRMKPM